MKLHWLTRLVGRFALPLLYLILYALRLVKRNESYPIEMDERDVIVRGTRRYRTDRLFIIDDDPGMYWDAMWKGHYALPWLRLGDPDGGFELIYAFRDPNAKVVGVTTTMGVSATELGAECTRRILKLLEIKDIPVLIGAKHPNELGVETEAARFIVDTVMENPGKVHIVATAPLTNIATALMLEPRLPEYWGALHFATGEFLGTLGVQSDLFLFSMLGIPDLNTNVDVKATQYVLDHGGTFPIYPNEVMDEIFFSRADYEFVKHAGTKLGDFIAYEVRVFNFLYGLIPGGDGLVPHGVAPTAIALDPTYECAFIESAIVMKEFGHRGHAFVLSNDPNLPKHKIYTSISDESKKRMHDTMIRRCI